MVYSKHSKEYIDNGYYKIESIDFMSVYAFKKKFNLSSSNRSSDGIELSKTCSIRHASKPDFGNYDVIWIYPVEELKKFYGMDTSPEYTQTKNIIKSTHTSAQRQKHSPFSNAEKTSRKCYGPPGTGKTRKMMKIIRKRLSEGIKPDEICFVSFTNVAANEAIERVSKEFPKYQAQDFPYFKTIHALATSLGGLDGKKIMTYQDMERFDKTIHSKPVWTEKGKAESIKVRSEHPCLTIKSLASARKTELIDQIKAMDDNQALWKSIEQSVIKNDWVRPQLNSLESAVEFWLKEYERYKDANNFVDYDDVIHKVLSKEFDTSILRFKLLIIDEAQDNSDFIWDFLKLMIAECKEVYICGDDDQAIMDGFGANSQAFLDIETTEKDLVLSKSWRLPIAHHQNLLGPEGALSVIKRFKPVRKEKEFTHNGDSTGAVISTIKDSENKLKAMSLEDLIRTIYLASDQEWLLISPTRASVDKASAALLHVGISHYKNNEPQYAAGRGTSILNVRVQTIHTSKGAEADRVAIILLSFGDNLMYSDEKSDRFNPTLRYVAESRAKKNLYLIK
jgi:superfamily I DNA/RNA helicase